MKVMRERSSSGLRGDVESRVYPDFDGLVLIGETRISRFSAKAYSGKRSKPDFFTAFESSAGMEKYIETWATAHRNRRALTARRRAERAEFEHTLKVGDILCDSWGYEQTNVDFYEVTAVIGKSVELRKVAQTCETREGYSDMSGWASAKPGEYLGPAFRKRVLPGNEVKISSYSWAGRWDGKPKYCSWYG